jgi:hypothetical protein
MAETSEKENEELLALRDQLKKDIAEEVTKQQSILDECKKLKGLVAQIMTSKSAKGIEIALPEDSEEEPPRGRRRQDKKKEEKEATEGAAAAKEAKAVVPEKPADTAAAPAKPASPEEIAAKALREKLRSSKTKTEFTECKAEAERLGLKHEASMAERKIAQL